MDSGTRWTEYLAPVLVILLTATAVAWILLARLERDRRLPGPGIPRALKLQPLPSPPAVGGGGRDPSEAR